MSRMINNKLSKDTDELVTKRLPLNPTSEDVFYQMADGHFFIKLLNLVDPDAVDLRTINQYGPSMNKFAIVTNINQAITAAKGHIKMVGVTDHAFTDRNEHIILGVLTQLSLMIAFVKLLELRSCPEILLLKYEDEEVSDFLKLKPEDILIRWVNFHLAAAGQEQRISNLGKDIADSTAMTYVLN